MKANVISFVQACDTCKLTKSENTPYPGLLQPLAIPDQAWTHFSMDFIEGLTKSDGKNVILVVVDRFSKYAHFLALSHPYTAISVAKLFMTMLANYMDFRIVLLQIGIPYSQVHFGQSFSNFWGLILTSLLLTILKVMGKLNA